MRKFFGFALTILLGLLICFIITPLASVKMVSAKIAFAAASSTPAPFNVQNKLITAAGTKIAGNSPAVNSGNIFYLPFVKNNVSSFSFVTMSDAQDDGYVLPATANQALALNPNFGIFVGDLESGGVSQSMMNTETTALGGLYAKMLLVRGNHDDEIAGSLTAWENYFVSANRPLPAGVSNLTALDSSSTYLNYSFDYGNSRFIGLDVPGDADLLSTTQLDFLDARLTQAESVGLVHAFIFFHGPPYCVESTHCGCQNKLDSSCTPSTLITLINKHPIVSATINGHEHLLAWTHMDSTRVAKLTHPYEQFLTSPSGSVTYNAYLYPQRVDYANTQEAEAFGAISVNGNSFTVKFYRVGTTAPVWQKTFTK